MNYMCQITMINSGQNFWGATLIAFLLPLVCESWGPVSHYYFACDALAQGNVFDCIKNPEHHNLIRGADMPDGLAGFASPAFQYGSRCPPSSVGIALHNPEFGGYMMQWAAESGQTKEVQDTVKGFAAHMIGDLVGFSTSGGYLSKGLATKFGPVNWITMWPKMSAIDSYLMHKGSIKPSDLPQRPISDSVAAFIANSTLRYRVLKNNTTPAYSEGTVNECLHTWQDMIDRLYPYNTGALGPQVYQPQLVYFDERNNTNFAGTQKFLEANIQCASMATQAFWKMIEGGRVPARAVEQIVAYTAQLYNSGLCV